MNAEATDTRVARPRPAGEARAAGASSPTRRTCSSSTAAPARSTPRPRALAELGVTDVAVCGLAKRLEEVWLPGEDSPVILPRTSEGLYLLQRVRDEAHRFAITYHRSKRSPRMTAAALDACPASGQLAAGGAAAALRLGAQAEAGDGRARSRRCRASGRDGRGGLGALHGDRRTQDRRHQDPRHQGAAANGGTDMSDGGGDERGRRVTRDASSSPGCPAPAAARRPRSLEDLDWFVADNLPPALMRDDGRPGPAGAGRGTQARRGGGRAQPRVLRRDLESAHQPTCDARGVHPYVLFLEATDETLVRRFDSVSRPHPLQEGGRIVRRASPPSAS